MPSIVENALGNSLTGFLSSLYPCIRIVCLLDQIDSELLTEEVVHLLRLECVVLAAS